MAVRLGEHDILTAEDFRTNAMEPFTVQDIDVESAIAYSKHDNLKKLNNIGLIRLKSPANLKKPNIGTVCLPVEEGNQFDNLDELDPDIKKHLIVAGLKIT